MESPKESAPEGSAGTQRVVESLEKLVTDFVLDESRSTRFGTFNAPGKDVSTVPDVILVVDLNTANPTAGFVAPALGHPHCVFLPVFQAMFKERKTLLVGSGSSSKHSHNGQPGSDWTTEFLSHCKKLLQMELRRSLDVLNVHISFTTRGDISEKDKAKLGESVDRAGFKKSPDDTVLIFPTIDAVAIEIVRSYGNLNFNGAIQTNQPKKLKDGSHMLVIYSDGDVAEIQSYSITLLAAEKTSYANRLELEDIVCGETVDFGKLVDERFRVWLRSTFGNSLHQLSKEEIGLNGRLMHEFRAIRRSYKARQCDEYELHLRLRDPPSGSPYDSRNQVCILLDYTVRTFFESAAKALLDSLDSHRAGIGKAKKSIDQTIFAAPDGISPYVEDLVKNWRRGAGMMTNDVVVFRSGVDNSAVNDSDDDGGLLRFVPSQEMITEGVIRGNYPEIDVRKCSPYHYGFGSRHPFESGDPEWSRTKDVWHDADYCNATVVWHVRKNQLLDNLSTMQTELRQHFVEGQDYKFDLKVYKSRLDDQPRWRYADGYNNLHPEVKAVGTVQLTFSQEDAERGERKECTDGKCRRMLPFRVEVSVLPRIARIRVKAVSDDGREIGNAMFVYETPSS